MKKLLMIFAAAACMGSASAREGLTFGEDGKFKIVQLTDLHYMTSNESSARGLDMIERILDAEQPDMVVLTGDIVVSTPARGGWDEVLEPIIERRIPYAVTLGNHDDEQDWTRSQIMEYVSGKPFSLASRGPQELTGEGNYVLEVEGRAGGAALYFMDSGAYAPLGEYAWFGFDQVQWFRGESAGRKRPSVAFFHIPLREYSELSGVLGTRMEEECSGAINTGMFAAMLESRNVLGVFVGHDHNNDYIGRLHDIYLAYGRFSGSRTIYNDIGRGARVIELTDGAPWLNTWIRTSEGDVLYKIVND